MLAGGQCRSPQRIVRTREYSTRTTQSRGRTFDSIRATASTGSSGFLPFLHCVHLSFVVDIHARGAFRRRRYVESASLRHAEECRISFGPQRHGVPQARRGQQDHIAGGIRLRSGVPAVAHGLRSRPRRCRRGGPGAAFPCRQRAHRDARRPGAPVGYRLTAGSIVSVDRARSSRCRRPACRHEEKL